MFFDFNGLKINPKNSISIFLLTWDDQLDKFQIKKPKPDLRF